VGGIYLIRDGGELVEMTEQPYGTEELLQKLLADYPNWTCIGSVDCLRLRTVRGKESSAENQPDLPAGVSPRSHPAG